MTVRIENLAVRYGPTEVLHGVDLFIESGERFAVMGPSGSGKSTLIRAIAGIIPSTGRVAVGDQDVSGLPPHERPIGLMFQDYALFPHLNVFDNVAYGLRMHGVEKARRTDIASDMLERVELAAFAHRNVTSLSGGQQQRVALARTLAPSPQLIMLDEPLGSLDLDLRETLLAQMRRTLSNLGTTTIYVTHDRGEAFSFADRVAVLIDGSIAAVDTPQGLWSNPCTVEIARLIGHANVVKGAEFGLEGWVAIPVDALTVDDGGTITATVVDVTFSDGRFLSTMQLPSGAEVRVLTKVALRIGANTGLSINHDRVIRLAG